MIRVLRTVRYRDETTEAIAEHDWVFDLESITEGLQVLSPLIQIPVLRGRPVISVPVRDGRGRRPELRRPEQRREVCKLNGRIRVRRVAESAWAPRASAARRDAI